MIRCRARFASASPASRLKHDGTYNSGGYVRQGVTAVDDPVTSPGRLSSAGLHASGDRTARVVSRPPAQRVYRRAAAARNPKRCSTSCGSTRRATNSPGTTNGRSATWCCGTIAAPCTGAIRSIRLPPHPASHADQGRGAPIRVSAAQQPARTASRRRSLFSPPRVVLGLLCVMYLILFVNRVSISTAAPLMKADLGLSNTQLGLAFSAFAIPYALFQLIGGWIGDRLGPRLTLAVCCAHRSGRHRAHGRGGRIRVAVCAAPGAWVSAKAPRFPPPRARWPAGRRWDAGASRKGSRTRSAASEMR